MAYALASRLERAVKNAGVKYKKVSGWSSRGHGSMGSIKTIVAHHTAGPLRGNSPSLNVVAYGRPGLSGPLSQLFLARDGTVYLVAAGVSYHAGRVRSSSYGNSHSIGIEAENTGLSNDPWPAHQIDAYAKLCKALCKEFGLSTSRVLGHREVCSPVGRKSDPSFSMSDFRKKVGGAKGGVSSGGGTSGGSSSRTYKTVSGSTPLVKLYHKGEPVKRIQKAVGVKVDSYYGPSTVAAVKKWQKANGLAADGIFGKNSWAVLNGGKAKKPKKSSAPTFPLPKGHWYAVESSNPKNHSGYYTKDRAGIKQFQAKLKDRGWSISVDGIFGNGTKKVVGQYQAEKGLRKDYAVGAKTWAAIWEYPIT